MVLIVGEELQQGRGIQPWRDVHINFLIGGVWIFFVGGLGLLIVCEVVKKKFHEPLQGFDPKVMEEELKAAGVKRESPPEKELQQGQGGRGTYL